jgi:hypothetical protein
MLSLFLTFIVYSLFYLIKKAKLPPKVKPVLPIVKRINPAMKLFEALLINKILPAMNKTAPR